MAGSRLYRVFVSSPSDVFGERERIDRVIGRLNGELGDGASLQAIRWEQTYYTADKTFQDQIILPSQTDLVICILWKRLGAELPPAYRRPDGTTPTGTEYEFEEAIQAARAKGTPDVIVYRKTAAVLLDAEHIDLEKAQFDALKYFWSRWFQTDAGHFTAAFESFESTDQFEVMVEAHIRQWLARNQAELTGNATWPIPLKGSPFRGLQPFDEAHAEVFFGRRRVIERLREALTEAAARGTPFLLLLGMSGSGKSSAARAGLLPRITRIGAVPGVDLWRRCVFRPSEGGDDGLLGLAGALYRADALPELGAGDNPAPADFAALLRNAPEAAARAVRIALGRAGAVVAKREGFDRAVKSRLFLVIDQFEEALGGMPESRERFGAALAALAAQGQTWIVGTLRSDLYAGFQASASLVALRERGALFDLLPPSQSEIAEIVTGPAEAAGLRFETRPGGGGLDEELIAAADKPGSLPLLQLALDELFASRDPQTNTLPVAAYDAFGGLAGVVERRAEETLAGLDSEAAGALPGLLAALVNVSEDGVIASRPAPRAGAESARGAKRLIDALVAARLLVADERQGEAGVRVAHEALVGGWPRAQAIIAADQDALRVRGRVEDAARRWLREGKDPDFLLPPGRPLAEAADLAASRPGQLSADMSAFVDASRQAEAARQAEAKAHSERELRLQSEASRARADAALRVARRTRMAALAVSMLFFITAGAAVMAFAARHEAQRRAAEATQNFAAALKGATSIVTTVNAHLRDGVMSKQAARLLLETAELNLGALAASKPEDAAAPDLADARSKLQSAFAGVLLALGDTPGSLARARDAAAIADRVAAEAPTDARQRARSVTQNEMGDALDAAGDRTGALAAYRLSAAIMEPLVARDPGNAGWARDSQVSRDHIAMTLRQQGDTAGALALYKEGLAATDNAAATHPEDANAQRDLATALEHVGDMLQARGDPAGAAKVYTREAEVARALAARAPDHLEWRRTLAFAEGSIASLLLSTGDTAAALTHARARLETTRTLASKDPANAEWQYDVSTSDMTVGAILAAQDDLAGSTDAFRDGIAVLEHLLGRDPANAGWQRQAALLHSSLGNVLTLRGDTVGARRELEAGLVSFEKAATAAPEDAGRQDDVARAQQVIGANLFAQGNFPEAVEHLRAGLAIAERLTARDPGNAVRASALADFRAVLGDALAQQGDTTGALALFDADRTDSERLARLHPENGQWQHEVAVSQQRAGAALQRKGDMAAALDRFKAALAASGDLAAKEPGKGQWIYDVVQAEQSIATVLMGTNELAGALDHASAALAKAEALLARDSTNGTWRVAVAVAHVGVGSALKRLGRDDEAKGHFEKASAVLRPAPAQADAKP